MYLCILAVSGALCDQMTNAWLPGAFLSYWSVDADQDLPYLELLCSPGRPAKQRTRTERENKVKIETHPAGCASEHRLPPLQLTPHSKLMWQYLPSVKETKVLVSVLQTGRTEAVLRIQKWITTCLECIISEIISTREYSYNYKALKGQHYHLTLVLLCEWRGLFVTRVFDNKYQLGNLERACSVPRYSGTSWDFY